MSDFVDPALPTARAVSASAAPPKSLRLDDAPLRILWTAMLNLAFSLVAIPALLATALLLLALNPRYNPGPLIFRQERVGEGGRIFRIYKFRTMTRLVGTETDAGIDANAGRITPLGRVLRKYRIDELPNFLNVALGDMNVIGPRPDAKLQADIYVDTVPGYRDRFRVRPGITGLAQVKQGYAACPASTRKKARFDRFYVRNRSVALDLAIILRTVHVMRTGYGSR